MTQPELYHTCHRSVKSIAGQIIGRHFSKVQWRPEGYHTYLDIGTGPGDVLMEYIYPRIANKFRRYICSDISPRMLEYFEECYGKPKNVEYRLIDIASGEGVPSELRGTIDHMTSIYVMHVVKNVEKSVQNMYELMHPRGGECLIVCLPKNTIFEAYDCLSRSTQWLAYKHAIEECISPLFYCDDPRSYFVDLFEKSGFSKITAESQTEVCSYDSKDILREGLKSICLVLRLLPTGDLQSEFLDDLVEMVSSLTQDLKKPDDIKYYMRFEIVAISAKRDNT